MTAGLGMLLAAAAVQVTAAPQASAADPGCWRDTCIGKSAAAMNCDDDAEVLDQFDIDTSIEVKLIWSQMCQATWAKVAIDPGYTDDPVYGQLWTTPTLGGIEKVYTTPQLGAGNPSEVTLMGNWKGTSKACWTSKDPSTEGDWDPVPLILEPGTGIMGAYTGACTDWI
ncbi:DUF2690 domain-containing protein [Streptomyces sp. V4-01]|uniref:DUF2690 domain-containing protein n=1 Tax=Actinacidiphila polyblastidii TaxID=3110430 RepID=A0ABU7PCF7_9ACTN|nr:DUF2690 domain-containing protein [Streptomyces sp. V4-01]